MSEHPGNSATDKTLAIKRMLEDWTTETKGGSQHYLSRRVASYISDLESRLEKAEAEREKQAEALDQLEDYLDNRADAEYYTDSPTPVPNEEMTLLGVVRNALGTAR